MKTFNEIYNFAKDKKGGKENLEELLPTIKTKRQLSRIKDDRYLAEMTRSIFQAGFVWRVVDSKWDDFEKVFNDFDIKMNAKITDQQLMKLKDDKRIIRNMQKIVTVQENAQMIIEIQKEYGSFAKFISSWPTSEFNELLLYLKENGSRLGGMSTQFFLRRIGKDGFIMTKDVATELKNQEIISGNPMSKSSLKKTQDAFNIWHEESGYNYAQLSRLLSYQV